MRNQKFRLGLYDSNVPWSIAAKLLQWVEHGQVTDPFIQTLITNDLAVAALVATGEEMTSLQDIVRTITGCGLRGAFFTPRALTNWPLYLAAEQRAREASNAFSTAEILQMIGTEQLKELLNGT